MATKLSVLSVLCALVVSFSSAETTSSVASIDADASLTWVDAKPFVRGTGFGPNVKSSFYDRLPGGAVKTTRGAVWSLSRDTAGMYLSFASNTSALSLNITYIYRDFAMSHFPSTGVAGLDLYAFDENRTAWRWVGTTHTQGPLLVAVNPLGAARNCSAENKNCALTRYRIHLPLYNGVEQLSIGFDQDQNSVLVADADPHQQIIDKTPPIVWYGTSIAQGGVASRPGMAFTNIISRALSRNVLNFGFSGNGLMEIGVGQWLTQIDAAAFVIDCSWNMQPGLIKSNAVPLVEFLRKDHPTTPIILVEDTEAGSAWIESSSRDLQFQKRLELHAAFTTLVANGDKNVYYVNHSSLFLFDELVAVDPDHIINPTVAGCHPSDLGQKSIADYYIDYLPTILKSNANNIGETLLVRPPHTSMNSTYDAQGHSATVAEASVHAETIASMEFEGSSKVTDSTLKFYTVGRDGLPVMGRAFNETADFFNRLPASAEGVVSEAVWGLSQMSTGMFVPFITNSSTIAWQWSLRLPAEPMWHMPNTGMHGADLFCLDGTNYRFIDAAMSFPSAVNQSLTLTLGAALDMPADGELHCVIYFPLRNTIAAAQIGITAGAVVKPDPMFSSDGVTWGNKKPIVWYGTSIEQGGVASRPGSTYTNILSRLLGRMVLNFGFAGHGLMETSVAQFLTQLDPAMFVIDCLPNLDASEVTTRTVPLIKYLRQVHPTVPIMLTAGTTYGDHWINPGSNDDKRAALKAQYDALIAEGDKNLHLFLDTNNELFAQQDLVNPTVGGTHPSDLGHREIATYWASVLPQLLQTFEKDV
eukprot:m.114901 g.114901  ORF g.114901 m.114901 type:complete len:813 (-) comp28380_c0_seq1:258-2696(-)